MPLDMRFLAESEKDRDVWIDGTVSGTDSFLGRIIEDEQSEVTPLYKSSSLKAGGYDHQT